MRVYKFFKVIVEKVSDGVISGIGMFKFFFWIIGCILRNIFFFIGEEVNNFWKE